MGFHASALLVLALLLSVSLPLAFAHVYGDPHLVGARGTRFDFNGELGATYCLLADKALFVNVLLDGYPTPAEPKGLRSWIKDLGILWKDASGAQHSLVLAARRGKEAGRGESGFLSSLLLDGAPMAPPQKVGDMVVAQGGISLKLHSQGSANGIHQDTFILVIDDLVQMGITLNPETPGLRTPDDAQVHFNLDFYKLKVSPEVHGVLGQTFQPGLNRVARAAEYQMLVQLRGEPIQADSASGAGFLDGTPSDYKTSAIAAPDCAFNKAWAA